MPEPLRGFSAPRSPNPPKPSLTSPTTAPVTSPSQETTVEGPSEAEVVQLHPPGLRGRLSHLRELAARRRQLGSSGHHQPRRVEDPDRPRRSRDSSSEAKVVDALAVTIRTATEWLDRTTQRRWPERDFVATAAESYAIAAPAAGYVLDHLPESGPLAELEEKAGLFGAGACTVSYVSRAFGGYPGGREEDEALKDQVAKRLAAARQKELERQGQVVQNVVAEGAARTAAVRAPSRAEMLGFAAYDGDGLEEVGPA